MDTETYQYFVTGFLWTCYAVKKQYLKYGYCWWQMIAVVILNFTLWPLAMIFAIFFEDCE